MKTKFLAAILLLLVSVVLNGRNLDSLRQVIRPMAFEVPALAPIPQNVAGIRVSAISLNGTWNFNPGEGSSGDSPKIEVPGEWEMQGFKVKKGGTATYSRSFSIPNEWMGNRVKIRFDGVSSNGVVRINGKTIGSHEGSFVAFEFDISDEVKSGDNLLEVDVQCETVSDLLACTSQYAAHPVGGILRKVTLFVLPVMHISDFSWSVKFDDQYRDAFLKISSTVTFNGRNDSTGSLLFSLQDAAGRPVELSRNTAVVPALATRNEISSTLNVKSPQKWDPEHPNLYLLTISLVANGKVLQTISQKIGFREIELRGNQFFVNNHAIKLRGVNRHEVHPLRGRSLTPELCRRDVELFRAGNCNYIRTSHYPPSEEFLQACDELGMFVESEASLCWIDHGASPIWKVWNYLDTKYLPDMVRANVENILSGRDHSCVIMWSLGNESRWSPLWERVMAEVKKLDPSRPTAFHDQCWGEYNNAKSTADVANYHYPGLNGPRECEKERGRPTVFGEYMHVQCYARRELETDPSVRSDAYANTLKQMVDSVYSYPACLGGAIWSGVDDIFHLSSDKICGYGPWGPIDGWRREKPEYIGMKKSYAPVIITNLQSAQALNGHLNLDIENRYNFTNLNELKIMVKLHGKQFQVKSNIPPMSKGSLNIAWPGVKTDDTLKITFTDPRGFICQEEVFHNGSATSPLAQPPVKVSLSDDSGNWIVRTGKCIYKINKINGLMGCATSEGDPIFAEGGAMTLIPFNRDDGGAPGVAASNYTQDIQPLDYLPGDNFIMDSVIPIRRADGSVEVNLTGKMENKLQGMRNYVFQTDGKVGISYDYVTLVNFSGNNLLRQFGLVFILPGSFDLLAWERIGLWTIYPQNDINRLKGFASALPRDLKYVEAPRVIPSGEWKDNANKLGTNDFRSTKDHILQASLENGKKQKVIVQSEGSQSARSWVDGDKTRFLIAGLNGPGSCHFFTGPRPEFKMGEHLSGKFTLMVK